MGLAKEFPIERDWMASVLEMHRMRKRVPA